MKRLITALGAAYALSACSSSQPELCGPEDNTGAYTSTGKIYTGSDTIHDICTVRGYALEEGARYHFNDGALIIDGHVPDRTRISVHNGKLTVNGNVGDRASLSANVSIDTHTESYMSICTSLDFEGNISTSPCLESETVFDGYTYPDTTSAVQVSGYVGEKVTIYSNQGIHVNEHAENVNLIDRSPGGSGSSFGIRVGPGIKLN